MNKETIVRIIERLKSAKLTETWHGYSDYGNKTIGEIITKIDIESYTQSTKESPAVKLIDIVLAANRNYNKHVEPNIKRIKKEYPDLKHFSQLEKLLESRSKEEFFKIRGHRDHKKYQTLKDILSIIPILKEKYPHAKDDYELIKNRAKDYDVSKHGEDIIWMIKNIGIATAQHIRMNFGIPTAKPDQRVQEVLNHEFWLKVNKIQAIKEIEKISQLTWISVFELDQMFVKYGSSYYKK